MTDDIQLPEPVATVLLDGAEKIIDASMTFFEFVALGTGLYTEAQVRAAVLADRERTADRERILGNLSMLVGRLVQRLRKSAPDDDLAPKALDYLQRNGLYSPRRDDATPATVKESVTVQDHAARDLDMVQAEVTGTPFELVSIVSDGYEGWANLIYTGEDCPGAPVAMLHPLFAEHMRRALERPPAADPVAEKLAEALRAVLPMAAALAVLKGPHDYLSAPIDKARAALAEWEQKGSA